MARLPSRDDLGSLPSARTGRAMVQAERSVPTGGAAVGQAIARIGPQIAKLGLTIQDKRDEVGRFDTERRYQDFKWNQAQTLDKTMRETQPGQAADLPETFTGAYAENAKAFFETVPERLRPEYDEKLFDTERGFYGKAATFARGEQKRFALQSIDEHKNRLALSADLPQARKDYDDLLAANPFLTPIEKDEKRTKDLDDLDEMNVAWRVSRGEGVESILRDLESPDTYRHLTPQRRAALVYKTKTALSEASQQEVDDDVARLRKGVPVPTDAEGKTSLDRAAGTLSRNQVERKRQDWQEAQLEHAAVSPLINMTDREAQAHILSIHPFAEKNGISYETADTVEDRAKKAVRDIQELRTKDRAASVLQAPEVIAAEEKIAKAQVSADVGPEEGGPLFAGSSPADAHAAWASRIEARKAAQRRQGALEDEIKAITRREAKELLQIPDPSTLPDSGVYYNRLVEAGNRADEVFGPDYAEEALRSAISFQRGDKEDKDAAASVLANLAKGRPVSEREVRQVGDLNDIARIGRAFDPPSFDEGRPAITPPAPVVPSSGQARIGNGRAVTLAPTPGQIDWLMADPNGRQGIFDYQFGPGAAAIEIAKTKKPAKSSKTGTPK